MLAVQAGRAAAPTGKPRLAADMQALLVGDTPGAVVLAAGRQAVAVPKPQPASLVVQEKTVQEKAVQAPRQGSAAAKPVKKPAKPASTAALPGN